MPQSLRARVGLDQLDLLAGAPRELQIAQCLRVEREDRARRAELRRHVADRRAVGQRQGRQPGPVELDELAHHPLVAQELGHRQHEIGRGRAVRQLAVQPEADHLRYQHRHRLAQHRRLRLDAAHAPTQDPEPIDHRRMRVGADQRVRVGTSADLVDEDRACEVFEVDLVHDPGVGRHDREVVERALPPAQERVALLVALELSLRVVSERVTRAEGVDLHGVVDDQLDRDRRVDLRRVAAHLSDRVAHRREVDDRRHTGEVLHQHARRGERDLLSRLGPRVPAGQRLDVGGRDAAVALVAQQVLEQDLQRERQPRDVETCLQGVEAEDLEPAAPDLEVGAGVKAVRRLTGSHYLFAHARRDFLRRSGSDDVRARAGGAQ